MEFGKKRKSAMGVLAVALVLSVIAVVPCGAAEDLGTWVKKAPMLTPREGLGAAAVGTIIYTICGETLAGPGDSRINEAYDTTTDTWFPRAPLAAAGPGLGRRAEMNQIVAAGGKIYVIGGRAPNPPPPLARILLQRVDEYDPATDTWDTPPPPPKTPLPPPARAGLAMAEVDGIIYVFGGRLSTGPGSGPFIPRVDAYDPATDTWAPPGLALMPTPRSDAIAVAVGGLIYVIGGQNASGPLDTVEVYDPATDSWTTKTSMPTARSHPVAGVCHGNIFVIGGADASWNGLNTNEAYDIAADTWVSAPPMPTARWEMASAQVGNTIYVMGGGGFGQVVAEGPNEAFVCTAPTAPPSVPSLSQRGTVIMAALLGALLLWTLSRRVVAADTARR